MEALQNFLEWLGGDVWGAPLLILLAIVQPQRPINLVEPVGKKVAFLRQSVLTLGLKNATVLAGKIECEH